MGNLLPDLLGLGPLPPCLALRRMSARLREHPTAWPGPRLAVGAPLGEPVQRFERASLVRECGRRVQLV